MGAALGGVAVQGGTGERWGEEDSAPQRFPLLPGTPFPRTPRETEARHQQAAYPSTL